MSTRRAAGFCLWRACGAYAQPFFLADVPDTFECPVCLRPGHIERERARREGPDRLIGEVRIEFDFDPVRRTYRKRTLTMDGRTHGRQSSFTLQSPLIRDRDAAVRVGRQLLRNLNRRFARPSVEPRPHTKSRAELIEEGWPVLA